MTEKRKQIEALQKENPNLSFQDACRLLGYDPNDIEQDVSQFFPWIKKE